MYLDWNLGSDNFEVTVWRPKIRQQRPVQSVLYLKPERCVLVNPDVVTAFGKLHT